MEQEDQLACSDHDRLLSDFELVALVPQPPKQANITKGQLSPTGRTCCFIIVLFKMMKSVIKYWIAER